VAAVNFPEDTSRGVIELGDVYDRDVRFGQVKQGQGYPDVPVNVPIVVSIDLEDALWGYFFELALTG